MSPVQIASYSQILTLKSSLQLQEDSSSGPYFLHMALSKKPVTLGATSMLEYSRQSKDPLYTAEFTQF
jgi:hypothetical protein